MLFNACMANQCFIHLFQLKKQMDFEILESLVKRPKYIAFIAIVYFQMQMNPFFGFLLFCKLKLMA